MYSFNTLAFLVYPYIVLTVFVSAQLYRYLTRHITGTWWSSELSG